MKCNETAKTLLFCSLIYTQATWNQIKSVATLIKRVLHVALVLTHTLITTQATAQL